ncbi:MULTISPECIES: helix-turn-helix transcriptional regulator [unclassified Streptomyces]|uniref:helix-turn-helix transcriptional regulator n=1 Tax=unclassified Streptomyces TaxID=2593676 RepID=UPI002B1CB4E4|nr:MULTISPECIES: helix-turn-helix transcriptional regulator [unclassified Streptomyces]
MEQAYTPGQLTKEARESRRMSQQDVADALNTAAGTVSLGRHSVYRWEAGLRLPEEWWPLLCQVLGIPEEVMEAAMARAVALRGGNRAPVPVALAGGLWGRADADTLAAMLDGDQAVTADNATAIAHAWLVTPPPQVAHQRAGRRIGAELLDDLDQRTVRLRRLDDFAGVTVLLPAVMKELRDTVKLAREASYTEENGRRLLALLSEQAQLAGWVTCDTGRVDQGVSLYLAGVKAAHAAGDRTLAALNLGCAGYAYANHGRASEGLLMARSALAGCEGSASPLERTLLLDKVAWTAAMAGQAREAERAVGRSTASHDQVDDDAERPDWLYWCSRDESDVMAGRVFTETHRPLRAVPLLTAALERYDTTHVREVALYSSWLAQAYVDANEIDEAAAVASRVYDLATASDSPRAVRRLDTILDALAPHRDTPAVRDLLERAAS